MAQSLLIRLRQDAPRTPIDVLAPEWVAPILQFMPEIRRIIKSPFKHGELHLKQRRRIATSLRTTGYQKAFVLPNSMKSALIPWFAGIAKRIGWRGEWRYLVLNTLYRPDSRTPTRLVERFAYLADGLNHGAPEPRLVVSSDAQRHVIQKHVPDAQTNPLVLAIGAEYGPAKRWPPRHFATVAQYWAQHRGHVWLLGTDADRKDATTICAALKPQMRSRCINLCGQTTLEEAVMLIAGATTVVSNDSGLMHIAAALRKPLIALFGSSSPEHTPPLCKSAVVLSMRLPCAPCFARVCPLKHGHCLTELSPRLVIKHLSA